MTTFEILVRGENFQIDPDSAERHNFLTRRLALGETQDDAVARVMNTLRDELRHDVYNKSADDMPAMYVQDVTVRDIGTIKARKEKLNTINWYLPEDEEGEEDSGD